MAGITVKDLAAKYGRPYAAVLRAAHAVGIETPRSRTEQRLITPDEAKQIKAELDQIKPRTRKAS